MVEAYVVLLQLGYDRLIFSYFIDQNRIWHAKNIFCDFIIPGNNMNTLDNFIIKMCVELSEHISRLFTHILIISSKRFSIGVVCFT